MTALRIPKRDVTDRSTPMTVASKSDVLCLATRQRGSKNKNSSLDFREPPHANLDLPISADTNSFRPSSNVSSLSLTERRQQKKQISPTISQVELTRFDHSLFGKRFFMTSQVTDPLHTMCNGHSRILLDE